MKRSQITLHYRKAATIATKLAVQRARKILKDHPNLDEFIMGMGRWMFTIKGVRDYHLSSGDRAYFAPLESLLREWDESLHITGYTVRFTATGRPKYDW